MISINADGRIACPPWRLSGTVLGPLHNDPTALAALGDAVHATPYKAPPKAPVLYVKPRNTLARSGAVVAVPADAAGYDVGATIGAVIGRTTCCVTADNALDSVAGWVLVADLCLPHARFYRPNVRARARDRSCLLGSTVIANASTFAADGARLRVSIDDRVVREFTLAGMRRPVAQLIQDVSDFMTLHPGDVLLLGTRHDAPLARGGQRFAVEADGKGVGLGRIEGRVIPEAEEGA